jgi:hypothetical protein
VSQTRTQTHAAKAQAGTGGVVEAPSTKRRQSSRATKRAGQTAQLQRRRVQRRAPATSACTVKRGRPGCIAREAVHLLSGTTHFVIVVCFFTSDTHMIKLQIFALWQRKKYVFTFFYLAYNELNDGRMTVLVTNPNLTATP